MRILVVGAIKGGTVSVGRGIYRALRELNSETEFLDYSGFEKEFRDVRAARDDNLARRFHLKIRTALIERVTAYKPDMILGVAQSPLNDSGILAELKKAGIVLCYWFTEDYRCFDYWTEIAPYFDYFFTIQKDPFWKELDALGCSNYHYLPTAFDKNLLCPPSMLRNTIPVSFIGTPYPNRVHYFSRFCPDGFQIYGEEWDKYPNASTIIGNRHITECEARDIYQCSLINLNVHSSLDPLGFADGDFVNPRLFELAGLGAFQLTDMRRLLTLHFDPADEIIALSAWDDMKKAVDYFLEHDAERRDLAKRAQERVLKEHTYRHRAEEILSVIS